MKILKILPEEQLLIQYCMIKHLILLKIQNMMDIKGVVLLLSENVLIKELQVVPIPSHAKSAAKNENM